MWACRLLHTSTMRSYSLACLLLFPVLTMGCSGAGTDGDELSNDVEAEARTATTAKCSAQLAPGEGFFYEWGHGSSRVSVQYTRDKTGIRISKLTAMVRNPEGRKGNDIEIGYLLPGSDAVHGVYRSEAVFKDAIPNTIRFRTPLTIPRGAQVVAITKWEISGGSDPRRQCGFTL